MYRALKIIGELRDAVQLTINGVPFKVSDDVPSGTSLNEFIREYANLRGTKVMCQEGGCGACIVAAKIRGETLAVNSCLVPVLNCNGWEITTIEGIGGKKTGYHPVQARLAQLNGSQCGYCSPGMVMNMYSLTHEKQLTMKEIENSFGSNICRCTGYRPILDAFKSFASDADPSLTQKIRDIEEIYKIKCPKTGQACNGKCPKAKQDNEVHMKLDDAEFHKVKSISSLFSIFDEHPCASYILNGGNTAQGVYRMEKPEIYIDVYNIPDLYRIEKDNDYLVIGGNISLTDAMKNFEKYSSQSGFEYLKHLAQHIDLIASVPVRNIGTIAGNLMLKHQHHEFPSDIFLILETAGAQIHILESPSDKVSMNLMNFLELDMKHKIIYSIVLPALSGEYQYRSYKIMPRAQNAHAHVNAGFLFKLNGTGEVLARPNIIIGGITPSFLHAENTEIFLNGKSILDNNVFKEAVEILDRELNPDHVLPDYSPAFRKTLAEGLFYKFVLSIKPDNVDDRLRSGGTILERGLSSGKQDFDTDKNIWPLNKPVPKIESIYQTSGEAHYVNDIKTLPDEVFCAFVLTNVPNGRIESIDATDALKIKDVVAFYTAEDIPGKNVFIPAEAKEVSLMYDEPIFADKNVLYACQPVGMIVAKTNAIANEAIKHVKVNYTTALSAKAVVTIQDAIASGDKNRFFTSGKTTAQRKGYDTRHVINGEFEMGGQYHYTMETQSCVCIPVEDGMDVYSSTQFMDLTQVAIATCLGIPNNSINIQVRRLGGGYGAKISRATLIACACALACHKLHRPARFIMSIESNMMTIGKRYPTLHKYEVGVDEKGTIQYMDSKHWGNAGWCFNEPMPHTIEHFHNCYDYSTWNCERVETKTDVPANTWCRAPASTEGIAMIEEVMEHIARVIGKDPLEVRLANMTNDDENVIRPLIDDLKRTADYDMRKRAVTTFNNENRWKKKGIALVPMKYPFTFWGQFNAMVSIYARDGTVSVTHGGIECGQGIHTKIAQVAAHILGIDLEMISVKPSNNMAAPNNSVTGGSVTSETCSYATMMACKIILKRLEPIKTELGNPSWKELVMAAYEKDVDLCARYMFTTKDDVKPYAIWGVTIAEVEVDLLTGQQIVRRVDIMEDSGVSMNPDVDMGQVEGAFVMGLGYWTSEDLIYDPNTAVLINNRTWNYKPPGAKDIPVDFRVSFRRNAPNPTFILRSKATGEPPLCMSCVVMFAIRDALNSARGDSGNSDLWYQLNGPVTTEKVLLTSLTDKNQMILQVPLPMDEWDIV